MQCLLRQQRLLSLLQLLYCNYNRNKKNNIINWMAWPWPSKQKLYQSVRTALDYVPSEAQPLMLCNGNMKCCGTRKTKPQSKYPDIITAWIVLCVYLSVSVSWFSWKLARATKWILYCKVLLPATIGKCCFSNSVHQLFFLHLCSWELCMIPVPGIRFDKEWMIPTTLCHTAPSSLHHVITTFSSCYGGFVTFDYVHLPLLPSHRSRGA